MLVVRPMEMVDSNDIVGGTPFVGVGKLKIVLFLKLTQFLSSQPLCIVTEKQQFFIVQMYRIIPIVNNIIFVYM